MTITDPAKQAALQGLNFCLTLPVWWNRFTPGKNKPLYGMTRNKRISQNYTAPYPTQATSHEGIMLEMLI